MLDENRKILYVGRTDDVAKRMRGHSDIEDAKIILLIECLDKYEVKYVEAFLINRYKPPYNSIIPTDKTVSLHLDNLMKHNQGSKFIRNEKFDIDWELSLSAVDQWARKHVSIKHQVAVYLNDDEYTLFKQYCDSKNRAMAGVIKEMLDNSILCEKIC